MLLDQIQGQATVGVTNSVFLGNVNANAQGGALAVGAGGLVQASLHPKLVCTFPGMSLPVHATNREFPARSTHLSVTS